VRDAVNVVAIALSFEVDASMLYGIGIETLNGFNSLGDIAWNSMVIDE
jgi:hypothetical protein